LGDENGAGTKQVGDSIKSETENETLSSKQAKKNKSKMTFFL